MNQLNININNLNTNLIMDIIKSCVMNMPPDHIETFICNALNCIKYLNNSPFNNNK